MIRSWLFGWLTLLVLPTAIAAPLVTAEIPQQAQDEPGQLLERMSQAIREVSYRGVLVFGNNQEWHTLSIQHQMKDGVEYEKVSHLTGAPRQMTRIGNRVSMTPHPDQLQAAVRKTGLLGPGLDERLPMMNQNYHLSSRLSPMQIAGRPVVEVQVIPQTADRYGQNLWLDRDTSLLLRADVVDEQQNVVERYQFAEVDIGVEFQPGEFALGDDSGLGEPLPEAPPESAPAETGWLPDWLPSGFSQASFQQQGDSSMLMFSDGLAAFSLFVDPIQGDAMPDISNRWGATSAVVRHLSRDGSTYRITLVGEVPMATAKRIAWSVVHREK